MAVSVSKSEQRWNSVTPGNGITGLSAISTLGALYIGQQFAIFLFGVSVVQSWTFAKRCGQDPLHLRAVVLLIMFVPTAGNVMLISMTSQDMWPS